MALRIGELMVNRGVLDESQVERILTAQNSCGRPFGVLAEEIYGIEPAVVESVWAEQYASLTTRLDPRHEPVDPRAVELVSTRQAWQFRLLPIRWDGGELVICTTEQHLPRALRFAYRNMGPACSFVLAEPVALGEALQRYRPMGGLSARYVDDEHMRELRAMYIGSGR